MSIDDEYEKIQRRVQRRVEKIRKAEGRNVRLPRRGSKKRAAVDAKIEAGIDPRLQSVRAKRLKKQRAITNLSINPEDFEPTCHADRCDDIATHVVSLSYRGDPKRPGTETIDDVIDRLSGESGLGDFDTSTTELHPLCKKHADNFIQTKALESKVDGFHPKIKNGALVTKKHLVKLEELEPLAATKNIGTNAPDVWVGNKIVRADHKSDTVRFRLLKFMKRSQRTMETVQVTDTGQVISSHPNAKNAGFSGKFDDLSQEKKDEIVNRLLFQEYLSKKPETMGIPTKYGDEQLGIQTPDLSEEYTIKPPQVVPEAEDNPMHPVNRQISALHGRDLTNDELEKLEKLEGLIDSLPHRTRTTDASITTQFGTEDRKNFVFRKLKQGNVPPEGVKRYTKLAHVCDKDCHQEPITGTDGKLRMRCPNKGTHSYYEDKDGPYVQVESLNPSPGRAGVNRFKLWNALLNLSGEHKDCCQGDITASFMHYLNAKSLPEDHPESIKPKIPVYLPGGKCNFCPWPKKHIPFMEDEESHDLAKQKAKDDGTFESISLIDHTCLDPECRGSHDHYNNISHHITNPRYTSGVKMMDDVLRDTHTSELYSRIDERSLDRPKGPKRRTKGGAPVNVDAEWDEVTDPINIRTSSSSKSEKPSVPEGFEEPTLTEQLPINNFSDIETYARAWQSGQVKPHSVSYAANDGTVVKVQIGKRNYFHTTRKFPYSPEGKVPALRSDHPMKEILSAPPVLCPECLASGDTSRGLVNLRDVPNHNAWHSAGSPLVNGKRANNRPAPLPRENIAGRRTRKAKGKPTETLSQALSKRAIIATGEEDQSLLDMGEEIYARLEQESLEKGADIISVKSDPEARKNRILHEERWKKDPLYNLPPSKETAAKYLAKHYLMKENPSLRYGPENPSGIKWDDNPAFCKRNPSIYATSWNGADCQGHSEADILKLAEQVHSIKCKNKCTEETHGDMHIYHKAILGLLPKSFITEHLPRTTKPGVSKQFAKPSEPPIPTVSAPPPASSSLWDDVETKPETPVSTPRISGARQTTETQRFTCDHCFLTLNVAQKSKLSTEDKKYCKDCTGES